MHDSFASITFADQTVPIWRISGPRQKAFHRFFDTSPISPSGRYIAFLETDFDDRLPNWDDTAQVVVLDLKNGGELYRTRTAAWDTQLGAQIQWGATDAALIFNRKAPQGNRAYGVIVNPFDGSEQTLNGQIYMVSPVGTVAASFRLEKLPRVQAGYGVIVAPEHIPTWRGWPDDEGLWVTDLETGRARLALGLGSIVRQIGAAELSIDLKKGYLSGFHVKWSPDGTRLLLLLRWLQDGSRQTRNFLFVCDANGGKLRLILHARNWGFGHHPNWCPDSRHVVMNLGRRGAGGLWGQIDRALAAVLRRAGISYHSASKDLCLAFLDTDMSEPAPQFIPKALGSGHPSLHPSGRFVLTDAYPTEPVARGDGTVPLRWIDRGTGQDSVLAHVPVRPPHRVAGNAWRVDPHPVIDRTGTKVAFNAAPDGIRGVFVADISGLLAAP
jgi:dipeptidyl aminopeptidase/acylaminoacyl peptidase